jgi:8-oxo-dGTP pyrophosphatase MutT (NUDIX family)
MRKKAYRSQYAVLPVAIRDGEFRVLLVTSRETQRWIVPKGWPEKGLTPAESAAKEAYEEAGLEGEVEGTPYGRYHYEKRLRTGENVHCEVDVFLMRVERELADWPERGQRRRRWVSPVEAASMIQEPDLAQLMLRLGGPALAPARRPRTRRAPAYPARAAKPA